MKISVTHNFPDMKRALSKAASQVPYAMSVALNKTAEKARLNVVKEMQQVFDRPTPWVLNSLRVKRSTKTMLVAELVYKDRNSVENSRSMVEPHVFAGKRRYKAMEARLWRAGLLPDGWNAVPGAAAKVDANGNMSAGQITQLLNVLGTYTEAGYNKANAKTVDRLKKGNVKKNQYGFTYFVNKVDNVKGKHLQPGVYQRVITAFGTSLKPVLIFVRRANYRKRLGFFETVQATVDREFPGEFKLAMDEALRTARF